MQPFKTWVWDTFALLQGKLHPFGCYLNIEEVQIVAKERRQRG